jgi:hypothetical protein
MNRVLIILCTVFSLALITLAGLEWMARLEKKHPGSIQFSESVDASKKNNFFSTYYQPLQDSVRLSQRATTIYFNSAFAEQGWRMDTSTFYLLSRKLPSSVYNIVINYFEQPSTLDFHFDLVPLANDNNNSGAVHYGNDLLVFTTAQLQDTFWFNIREKSRDSISVWIESDDVIGFTRNK